MDWKLELVLVPVSRRRPGQGLLRRAVRLRRWTSTTVPSDDFRVVQMTPPGSACSITIGMGITDGAARNDRRACTWSSPTSTRRVPSWPGAASRSARSFHFGADGREPGPHPERADYGSYIDVQRPRRQQLGRRRKSRGSRRRHDRRPRRRRPPPPLPPVTRAPSRRSPSGTVASCMCTATGCWPRSTRRRTRCRRRSCARGGAASASTAARDSGPGSTGSPRTSASTRSGSARVG